MFYTHKTFIGVDPTAGEKPIVYTAIDGELRLLALGRGNADDVLAFAAGQREAVIAICAPRQPNIELMRRQEIRQNLNPPPNPGRWENFRLVDYLLRQHGIPSPQTAHNEEDCPNWMRQGFIFYRRLQALGYRAYPEENVDRLFLEVYPHAIFAVLLDVLPLPKHSLEGRLQRQLALFKQEMEIPDPMRFFEEITRHRLLRGVLPFDELYTPGELDSLAAAYTAWQAAKNPGSVTLLGDPVEGQVVLPVPELKERYD